MKKLIIFIIIFCLFAKPVLASDTASKSATTSAKTQDLLDRVTTKVAELTNQLRRTYSGKIKSTGSSSISVSTAEGDRTISTNDVTTYYRIRSGNRSEINFSALKAGDDIVGAGTVDPQNSEMTARQIIAKIQRYNIVGTINEVNKQIIIVRETNGKTSTVDLSDAIALKKVDSSRKISTAKATEFQKGSMVFVIGYLANATATEYSVLKALVYPQ